MLQSEANPSRDYFSFFFFFFSLSLLTKPTTHQAPPWIYASSRAVLKPGGTEVQYDERHVLFPCYRLVPWLLLLYKETYYRKLLKPLCRGFTRKARDLWPLSPDHVCRERLRSPLQASETQPWCANFPVRNGSTICLRRFIERSAKFGVANEASRNTLRSLRELSSALCQYLRIFQTTYRMALQDKRRGMWERSGKWRMRGRRGKEVANEGGMPYRLFSQSPFLFRVFWDCRRSSEW